MTVLFIYPEYSTFCLLAGIISLYTVYNTFFAGSYPDKIIIADDYISFYSMGRVQYYSYCSIKYFKVRESRYSRDMFIRINKPLFGKGRFWFNANSFNNGNALYKYITNLENRIHPESLKSIAGNRCSHVEGR
ncbi:hypothetical protein J2S01_002800 [Pectinatus haikarae]|uniref:Photosystem I assembly protein Ycf4 n=2 Tax=Pectinatus haikarae TaxID=349096 RepID=A0ABT9YD01_9FIRM|nr:hypothetical protein [Pectinatus haikarae]